MPRDSFQDLVQEALGLIPAGFQPYLENVEVLVEDWPDPALLEEMEVPVGESLYGVFLGHPLTEGGTLPGELPGRIHIFRGPLQEDFPDPEDLRREVAITVVHELAHHFGIGEERLEELGWG
ncbi:MAG: metallopeptidase family protein [Acidobacteria bacterium]|nr:metallopeptidase family protein [Acidobacteriota bacterium]